ncbi:MAG TPA: hypothetical protein VIJ91_00580 [Candidatus Dormibacteraeota bacterium]
MTGYRSTCDTGRLRRAGLPIGVDISMDKSVMRDLKPFDPKSKALWSG